MSNLKDVKILLVEDEVKLSKLLKDAISDTFSSLSVAKDGFEGLKKFKKLNPDIVITDITMPNLDGLDMAREIKNIKPNTYIIILSAFSDKDKLLKAIDVGVDKYFIKPFDASELIEHLISISKNIHSVMMEKISDDFVFDKVNSSLYLKEKLIKLTRREKEFLNLLLKDKNTLVSLETIKEKLWPNHEEVTSERIRTFIKRLRFKTSKDLIENVSGQGYIIGQNK